MKEEEEKEKKDLEKDKGKALNSSATRQLGAIRPGADWAVAVCPACSRVSCWSQARGRLSAGGTGLSLSDSFPFSVPVTRPALREALRHSSEQGTCLTSRPWRAHNLGWRKDPYTIISVADVTRTQSSVWAPGGTVSFQDSKVEPWETGEGTHLGGSVPWLQPVSRERRTLSVTTPVTTPDSCTWRGVCNHRCGTLVRGQPPPFLPGFGSAVELHTVADALHERFRV